MNKYFKQLFRPPPRSQNNAFTGDYNSWADAMRNSTGYYAGVILEKTCAALLKVKNGEAVYERDSVLFDKIQHSFPVLAGLLRAAQSHDGRLCVVDFGGSLGSSYFQCRDFLRVVQRLEWLVVEQSAHVACGRKNFESEQLRFYNTIEECAESHQPNALLLSSVLQYLPDPYDVLQKILSLHIGHVIVDRTAFLASGRERLTIQNVPDSIYPGCFPAWFFSEIKFIEAINLAGYTLLADFPSADDISPEDEKAYFKGFIYEWRGK